MCSRPFLLRLLAPALAFLLLLPGCDRETAAPSGAESNDPDYAAGQQHDKEKREQEALAAYKRVISRRGDEAPESYLNAGLIYQNEIKNPVAAIYYFQKYLELRPDDHQMAELVRGYIQTAMRDFARTLPGQPLNTPAAELATKVDELTRENAQLRAELATATGGTVPAPHALPSMGATAPTIHPAPAPSPARGVAAGDPSVRTAPPPPGTTAPATGHKHVVAAGETLSAIAQKEYGNRSKWPQIQAANQDLLPTATTPLKVGMELIIP